MSKLEDESGKENDEINAFDFNEALRRAADDGEFLKEIIRIFFEESPNYMGRIKEAVGVRDSDAVMHSAHKLKGAVSNLGAKATFDTAFKLETMGREKNLDSVEQVYAKLEQDMDQLHKALKEIL